MNPLERRPDNRSADGTRAAGDAAQIAALAQAARSSSWEIALSCVSAASEMRLLSGLQSLSTVDQLGHLPALIGGVAAALGDLRVGAGSRSNPVLMRLARTHADKREAAGFDARQIVQEFMLVRRSLWWFVRANGQRLDVDTLLDVEERLNWILDEIVAECMTEYFDRATAALHERARRDALTGMLNHQAMLGRLGEEVERSRRYGHCLQVVYFDLDEFKQVNDTLGHGAGDTVLQVVSRIVGESIRETDVAGRMGGDEFVLGLVESDTLAAHLLVDRLRARLARYVAEGTVPEGVGISAGCASFPDDADSVEDLIALADQRQYTDKRARKRAAARTAALGTSSLEGTAPATHPIIDVRLPATRSDVDDAPAVT